MLSAAMVTMPACAQPELEPLDQAVCRLIERSAHADDLPVAFLTRVIWRESSFRPIVVSSAGAQGIAQFMPDTARERGLADPFDPEQAIPEAARFLADLRRQFGNLGIAAAAYNAGPARVTDWLRGQGGLPAETIAYVRFVTQHSVVDWIGSDGIWGGIKADADGGEGQTCVAIAGDLRQHEGDTGGGEERLGPFAPWGVQLSGSFSKAAALAAFSRASRQYARVIGDVQPMVIGQVLRSRGTRRFYQVRVPAQSRAAANALCGRIVAVGGACVALRS
jgi:hypothetical protein